MTTQNLTTAPEKAQQLMAGRPSEALAQEFMLLRGTSDAEAVARGWIFRELERRGDADLLL